MKKKGFDPRYLKDLYLFLGTSAISHLGLGILSGMALFAVELAFAYGLQGFLSALGLLGPEGVQLPRWVPANNLTHILIFIVLIGGARTLLQWSQAYLASASLEVQKFEQRIRILKWAFFSESTSSGEAMTLFNENANAAGMLINNLQTLSVLVVTSALLWVGLLYISPVPTLIATGFLALAGFLLRAVDFKIKRAGDQVNREITAVNTRILSNIKNLLLMQIYGTQGREEEQARAGLTRQLNHYLGYLKLTGLKYAFPQMTGICMVAVITLTALHNGAKPSLLISYFYLFIRFVQNFSEAVRTASQFHFFQPPMLKLMDWWKNKYLVGNFDNTPTTDLIKTRETFLPFGWTVANTSFSYAGGNVNVIENLNLNILPGETVVIMGPSGAGKSTLLYLLLGNFRPTKGQINISSGTEEFSLNSFKPRLLQNVGYVGPESFIIEGSINDNLFYGLDSIPTAMEVDEALRKAECQFVYDLPKGKEHILSEQGQGLSAGQKQRLSLARALLRKPKVLFLDEATSNLDTETEGRLVKTLSELKGQLTIIAVTHRQSLTAIADKVFHLDSQNISHKTQRDEKPLSGIESV